MLALLLAAGCVQLATPAGWAGPADAGGRYVTTENAYVKAPIVSVVSQVSGRVADVYVADNQVVRPGQKLRLSGPGRVSKGRASRWYTVKPGDTLFGIAQAAGIPYRTLAARNGVKPPYMIKPGQRLRIDQTEHKGGTRRTHSKKPVRQTQTAAVHRRHKPAASIRHWHWPTKGRVLYGFDSKKGRKGIDIAGNKGQSIVAAASGRVVYQGSGLRGYGKLIIIKHNEDYLSAYAHCDKIYVKEGDVLKRGQSIAAMGSTGASRVKLHFEIRYRGNPVNPLKYLPKK